MAALQEASENWDDDFEFQVEKRKMSTATAKTAKSEATENWDDDFEDSRQSPKKIIQRHREESWDDEEDDEDDENGEFGFFSEEDRTVTAKSRRAALARLSTPGHLFPPRSPTSSVFSVPTTVHTYSSTAHLRPTSAFALIPPSPPIHKERERRRLRKKSRPKPQAVFELVEIPSQGRSSFSDVDLPRPGSELGSRKTSRSDLSINERPPLVVTTVADTLIGPSNEPGSIPQTPTKGAALLSRIGSVKKWGIRRKRGDSTTPADANESPIEREAISNISKWDPRRRKRGDSITPADTIPLGSQADQDTASQSHLPTPRKGRRRGGSTIPADVISNDLRNESDHRLTPRASSSLSSHRPRQPQQHSLPPPLPSALPSPVEDESSHPPTQSQSQLQLEVQQQRPPSSNWFFRSASKSSSSTNNDLASTHFFPSAGVVRSTSKSKAEKGRDGDANPTRNNNSTFYSRTPNASRTDLDERGEASVSRTSEKGKDSFVASSNGNPKFPTSTATTPTKLVKRKSFGFVHLGRGFGGHGGGENEAVGEVDEVEGEGKQDVTGRADDRMKYAGLGLGRANVRGGDESESTPKNEKRSRRRSLSRLLMDRDKENKDTDIDYELEKEKDNENENHPKEKGKEGTRSFMGSVRRISLVSVGVVGRHKKTKSGAGAFIGVGGDSLAPIPPVPASLPPALSCASQVSLRIPSSSAAATNMDSHQQHTSSHTSTADLLRAASLSSPSGDAGFRDPTAPSVPVTPVRSPSSSHHSRPPSISSTKKRRRTLSRPRSKPRKSEESSQEFRDGSLKYGLDFEQEQVPFFHPSEERDTASLRTPTQSASLPTATDKPTPLLPPIELQPPSPPRTIATSHTQRRSRAYTTNELIEGLETLIVTPSTSSSLGFFTPSSSFTRENVGSCAIGAGGILPLPSLSPSKLSPGKSPQSQQSVSLGRSTAANVAAASGGDESTGSGSGGTGGLPRRNSLGDLKIPARISQAQVGLRRDLGMVREFASNVEQLKELQNTYNGLVVEVQALLDNHVHLRSPVQLPPQPVEIAPSVPSSNFFTQLRSKPKNRVRSNTVGSTATHASGVDSSSLNVPSSQVAYKTLVETFWGINSKYKVSWECAELLIELGSGSGGGGDGDGSGSGVMSALPSAATTSVSAPVMQHYLAGDVGEGKTFSLKGRERAITLVGDETKQSITPPLSPTAPNEAQTHSQSQPPSAIISVTSSNSMPGSLPSSNFTGNGGPPLASPPNMSWRASTGRHDLSHRQLVLLREMLNNNGSASIVGTSDNEARLGPPPPPFPILPEDHEAHPLASSPYPSSHSQFVNRDWRWGDARNSTITLSEEQESGFGAAGERRDVKMDKEKKRRSGRLGMGGIRDMLRSLKKSHVEEPLQIGSSTSDEAQSGQQYHHHHHHGRLPTAVALAHPMMHSTTSLSAESSIGAKGVHNQAQAQQSQNRLPIPRIPSQIRRRRRSSTEPESMSSNKGLFSPSSFTLPKSSPRRPSLASIFRIGNNKMRPVTVLHTGVGVSAGVEDPASLPSAFGASEHDLSAAQYSSGNTGTGCEESNSIGEEEEDWDRMDSVSDLDAAATKALGNVDGTYDVSATVRGRSRVKTKGDEKKKAGVSPYLQNQTSHENDQHDPPPLPSLPASSSSTSLGNFLARHSIIPKRSFSASQSSFFSGDGQQHPPSVPSRLSRHSNFEEQLPTDTASVEPPMSLHISSSKSAPTTTQSKLPNDNCATASSRPSSSRSTKFPNAKSGSIRSMPPHLVTSSLPRGQQLSPLSSSPDPKRGMIMTPENIKPLLENAKEVHVKLHECIVEIRALIADGTTAVGHSVAAQTSSA